MTVTTAILLVLLAAGVCFGYRLWRGPTLVDRVIAVEADVKGMEKLLRNLLRQDDRLGRQRPRETAALLATLDLRLDAARRLRLASRSASVAARYQRGLPSNSAAVLRSSSTCVPSYIADTSDGERSLDAGTEGRQDR